MNHPWFKFHPTDWRADPRLRMCPLAARGLWMEMLCIMHEAEPRGSLLINGNKVSGQQLAALAGISLKEVLPLLGDLAGAGVFSREDDGTIYSRRMRRDQERFERDKANGKTGGNPKLKAGVNPPDIQADKAKMLDARLEIPESKKEKEGSATSAERPKPERKKPSKSISDDWRPSIELRQFARGKGIYDRKFDLEMEKFRNHARMHDRKCVNWDMAARNWLLGTVEKNGISPPKPMAEALADAKLIHVQDGTPEMEAWDRHWRQTKGVNAPRSKHGGIFVETQWPPGEPHARNDHADQSPRP